MLEVDLLDLRRGKAGAALKAIAARAPALAGVAARWERCLRLRSAMAPGLAQIGATVAASAEEAAAYGAAAISASGNGTDIESALTAALGETADLLSQVERPGDVLPAARGIWREGWLETVLGAAGAVDALPARLPGSGETVLVPADLVLRRPAARRVIAPVGALSAGCAAGADAESAGLRAVLELVERDAAALWWLGGRRPGGFTLDHPAARAGEALLSRLRRGAKAWRQTRLLDLGARLGVPVVAAISMDRDGRGLACGLAARLDAAAAAEAAIGELCQMELAAPVAAAKRESRGEAALGEADRAHLARAAFQASDCALLEPAEEAATLEAAPPDSLATLVARLGGLGHEVALVDLSRAGLGVVVTRALAPTLQPFTAAVKSRRLARLIAETGGGDIFTRGTPLF